MSSPRRLFVGELRFDGEWFPSLTLWGIPPGSLVAKSPEYAALILERHPRSENEEGRRVVEYGPVGEFEVALADLVKWIGFGRLAEKDAPFGLQVAVSCARSLLGGGS